MSEEYMNKKVRPILEEIVDSLLDNTPEDPILYIYTWLVNYKNCKKLKDRLELESLRKKIEKLENQNEDHNSDSDKNDYKESLIQENSSDIPSVDFSDKN